MNALNEIVIENMIYEIRGKQVMLDSDLARLYNCVNGAKTINQAVKRNIEKFPEDFYFQLTMSDAMKLQSQFGTAILNKMSRVLPYAFTEQGVAMLATVIKTNIASQVSVSIMRAFVMMRKYLSASLIEQKYVNDMVFQHEYDIKLLQQSFDLLQEKEKTNSIFFEGQIYDAYSLLIDIFSQSKSEIIIIDNYIDKNLLDVLSNINKNVTIITNKYNNNDYEKYRKQYDNVNVKIDNGFHDRFIIIDKTILYHCGASFKDLGNKCFAISKIGDIEYLNKLLEKIDGLLKNNYSVL